MPKLASKSQCTGCTACASSCPRQCIQMKEDKAGFLFPEMVRKAECIACGICEQVCPVLKIKCEKAGTTAYAIFTKNDSIRLQSSSGGVFSELSGVILRDGGDVYGASYDEDGTVRHIRIDEERNLEKLRGAKYSQSILENSFQMIKDSLEMGKKVLFSGLPCQVAGLKSFLKRDYENLFCVDFVCHGVPSPMAWEKYIQYRSQSDCEGTLPISINLRNKESGWSHYSYSVEFSYPNGSRYLCKNNSDLFMRFFVGNYISRESCDDCHFKGYDRVSDITLGDFWGIWNVEPEMDDNKGTSLVLTHTSKGENILKVIERKIKCKKVSLEQAASGNPSILYSSAHKKEREKILMVLAQNGFEAAIPLIEEDISRKRMAHGIIGKVFRRLQGLK